jgi:hypothetical protein
MSIRSRGPAWSRLVGHGVEVVGGRGDQGFLKRTDGIYQDFRALKRWVSIWDFLGFSGDFNKGLLDFFLW